MAACSPLVSWRSARSRKIRVDRRPSVWYTRTMTENRLSQQSEDYQRVAQAIHFLEENYRRHPSLEEIASSAHLSQYHFQRLFKRWAGVSPTQFIQFLTLEYAKGKLEDAASVLDAALDSGLSGPGRLHDLFVTLEAVTPGDYRRQGAGLQIAYGYHHTPFGMCLLARTERGICALHFVDGDASAAWEALVQNWPQARFEEEPETTQPLVDQIFRAGQGDRSRPFHLQLKGTNFQVNVWRALLAIAPGSLVSYGNIAAYLGHPQASRAVASVVARNPVAYLIPCHRVIKKGGQTHGYRWGATRKKAMIGWEASRELQTGLR
jgi:AraC family transcriptional regulator of adaptative response/methylated-DNA-[protein]-cysteine methyltransferase